MAIVACGSEIRYWGMDSPEKYSAPAAVVEDVLERNNIGDLIRC